jgi:ribosome-associated toxin RatA of RatAB toxin-antitoxin module
MPIVEDSILIEGPVHNLFALSQDYALRRAWDSFTRDMRFVDGAQEAAKGVRVWVRAWTGLTMEVQFVSFRPPTFVAMKMIQGPWFFEKFAGIWLFKSQGKSQTQVTFRYSFTTKGCWLRWLINSIIACVFRRDVRARLRGLKRGAEQLGLRGRSASKGSPCSRFGLTPVSPPELN